MAPTPAFDLGDPEWYAHRFVESDDAFRFVRLERARHAAVPFLTDAYLGELGPSFDVPTEQCLETTSGGSLHFLFHSAFCGSTMLTRALDRPGMAMGLSEPVVLNDVLGFRWRGAERRAVARTADAALRVLARPFGAREAVVVKPSNIVNPLAELLLMLQPQARAVFLHAPLETFLISVVRKGLHCRLWVRELLEAYLREGYVDLGFAADDYFRMSDLQVAAVGWLAQHARFQKLAEKHGDGRLVGLDADRMLADPQRAMAAVTGHFGLNCDATTVAEVATGPAFARHSKSGAAFTPESREIEYGEARAAHGDEIGMVLAWAEKVADGAKVPMAFPGALLA